MTLKHLKYAYTLSLIIWVILLNPIQTEAQDTYYSIQVELEGYRSKKKSERWVQGLLGRLIPYPNPTIYAIMKIEGSDPMLVPYREREAEGRTIHLSFAGSRKWVGRDFMIEFWEDKGNSDAFWKAVLSSIEVDVQVGTTPLLPLVISGNVRIKTDKDALSRVRIVGDNFVAQFKSSIPQIGHSVAGDLKGSASPTAIMGVIPTFGALEHTVNLGQIRFKTIRN